MGLFDRFRSGRPGAAGPTSTGDAAGAGPFRLIDEPGGRSWLTLDLGDLPTDQVVQDAGEEPNGAFWEGVTAYLAPDVTTRVEMDSEGSMFAVGGGRADLEQVRELLLPLLGEGQAMTDLLTRARADGVTLEGYGR